MVDKSLPLDLNYFEKIIVFNAIFDQNYLETILEFAEPVYFVDKNIQTVFKVLRRFYIEHKVAPNLTEFKAHLSTQEEKDALKEVVVGFKTIDQNYNKELLIKNTERFLKERSVLNTVVETSIDVNSGKIDSAKILKQFEKACGLSLTDNIGMDYLENIDNHCKDLQQVFKTISTGWKWLDKQIGGGFMAEGRALYCFFGVTNVGKSIFLGNIATNILSQDKTVVLISLEMPEQVYAKRISAQLSRIPNDDLRIQIDPLRNFINQYKIKNRKAKLIIKEFPPKSVTILAIKSYLNKLVSKGIKPDAIIIDYVNLIAPMTNGLGSYETVKTITEGMRALSYDFACPIITATQANRAAVKEAQPDMDKVGESMGLVHTVDAQFSIWTQDGDSDLGIIHYGIIKNRFGPREVYSHLNIDYPTLSLTEPSDVVSEFSVKGSAPKLTADIESSAMDSSILDTLNMIDNLTS
jgi:replicative DNA helicase